MSSPTTLSFLQAARQRRSFRSLDPKTTVPDQAIIDLAREALQIVPSAYSSSTTRLTLLFGDNHKKLWSITSESLLKKIGEERYHGGTNKKMDAFSDSYATILFWDDSKAVKELYDSCPEIYKDKVNEWVHQSNGMFQYFLWTGLSALNLGANLQHYNPLIDEKVKQRWNIPADWQLRAQMVIGVVKEGSDPGERKLKYSIDEMISSFGNDIPKI